MRTFLRVFIGFFLIIGLPVLIFVSSVVFQSLNADSYIKAADNSGIYSEVDNILEETITEELKDFEFDSEVDTEFTLSFLSSEEVQNDLKQIFRDTIQKVEITDFLRDVVNGNLESSLGYITSEQKEFLIYVPTGDLIESFTDSYDFMANEIRELADTFPICSNADLERLSGNPNSKIIDCIPEDAKQEFNRYLDTDFENQYKDVLEEFKSKTSKSSLTVDEYYEVYGNDLDEETETDLYEVEENFRDARNAFSIFKIIMIGLIILFTLLIICYGALKRGNPIVKIKSISKLWIVVSTIMLITYSVIYLIIRANLKDAILTEFDNNGELSASATEATGNIIINAVNNLIKPFGLISLGIFLASMICYLILKVYLKQAERLQNVRVV